MKIKLLCIGKLKEKYYAEAAAEFQKRLARYCSLEIIELPDEKAPENLSPLQKEQIKKAEGERLLSHVGSCEFAIALMIEGEKLSSEKFAEKMDGWMNSGKSGICFMVGGSLGLSVEARNRADFILSFSDMTFTHQMFRIMLLEQVYRAFKIIRNETYHK
ncbi:MAG: Ribosomal RNA large subunit methyltransferase H [Firmicutes bacterium ADurb.Bin182]|nr:MAG: Ribosomal RNA large subunit methyltransferase H [Firmicutes bacterium ADurb.Bin182]